MQRVMKAILSRTDVLRYGTGLLLLAAVLRLLRRAQPEADAVDGA